MNKKLYKSSKNKIIGGVCGGIAEYFNIDPVIIRLIWIVLAIANSAFLILYLIGLVLIPKKNDEDEQEEVSGDKNAKLAMIVGLGFIIWGAVKIAEKIFDKLDIRLFPFDFSFSIISWPLILIVIGIIVILLVRRNEK